MPNAIMTIIIKKYKFKKRQKHIYFLSDFEKCPYIFENYIFVKIRKIIKKLKILNTSHKWETPISGHFPISVKLMFIFFSKLLDFNSFYYFLEF